MVLCKEIAPLVGSLYQKEKQQQQKTLERTKKSNEKKSYNFQRKLCRFELADFFFAKMVTFLKSGVSKGRLVLHI